MAFRDRGSASAKARTQRASAAVCRRSVGTHLAPLAKSGDLVKDHARIRGAVDRARSLERRPRRRGHRLTVRDIRAELTVVRLSWGPTSATRLAWGRSTTVRGAAKT
jgi:hypothetical protein